jgi:glycosyltransferase involved in cell wall biosynthesis
MAKISVIIPVYNAEKYLHECIGSLLAQTLQDCEFIFVDDGSTDISRQVIESYRTDDRIILVSQENQGVSAARNRGIGMATGEYLGFVDADDFVERDMFEKLCSLADEHGSDIVISNFYAEQGNSKILVSFDFPVNHNYGRNEIRNSVFPYFVEKDLNNSACNKVFRRQLISEKEISFPGGMALGEDAIFNMKAFRYCDRAYYTEYAGYHYREVSGSATRNILNKNYFTKALDAFQFDYADTLGFDIAPDELEKLKSVRLVNNVISLIHLYFCATEVSLGQRFSAVRTMVNSPEVTKSVHRYFDELAKSASGYKRFLLKSLKNKDIYKIYLAVLYSRFRNR